MYIHGWTSYIPAQFYIHVMYYYVRIKYNNFRIINKSVNFSIVYYNQLFQISPMFFSSLTLYILK